MGFAPAALLFGGLTMQVMGGMQAARAQRQEGEDYAAMMEYNAKVKEAEAKQLELKSKQIAEKGKYDSQRQAEAADRQMSALKAGLGASGAVPTAGTPLLIQAKQASELELDNLMIGYNTQLDQYDTQLEANAVRSGASLNRMQGGIYKRAGRNAATATYLNTGGTILGGLYNSGYFNQKKPALNN